jgi:competence protein ComEA
MPRSQRFILLLMATVFTAMFVFSGHGPSHQDGTVAFFSWPSSVVTVRVKGTVPAPGIYTLPQGATVVDVIKMTVPFPPTSLVDQPILHTFLRSGDVVEVIGENPRSLVIRLTGMKAGEQIVLGIPLHPDRLDRDDWDSLPGIGPKLANNIVVDRQIYGDFGSVEALRRVAGMGEKKLGMIRKYFNSR